MDHSSEIPTATDIVQAAPGLVLSWQLDRRMLNLKFASMSRETVDAWLVTLKPIMQDWPREKPFLVVYDATDPHVALTPYLQARLKEFAKVSGGLKGRVALVLARTFVAQLVQLYMRTQTHAGIQTRIFFDVDEGQRWVLQFLDTSPETKP